MKRKISFWVALFSFATLLVTGCKKDEPFIPEFDVARVVVTDIPADGLTKSLGIIANVPWKISGDTEWCSITPKAGTENKTVSIELKPNDTNEPRSTTLIVTAEGFNPVEIAVSQTGTKSFDVSRTVLTDIHSDGISRELSIFAPGEWSISGATDWCVINSKSGSGNKDVLVTVKPNTKSEPRSTTLTVTAKGYKPIEVPVSQQPLKEFNVGRVVLTDIEADGLTKELSVTSNVAWAVTGMTDWCTVTPAAGTGNAKPTVAVSANTKSETRSTTLIFKANGYADIEVAVSQLQSKGFDVARVVLTELPYAGATKDLAITSEVAWSITGMPDWCTVTPASGTGDAVAKVRVNTNLYGKARSTTLTVRAEGYAPVELAVSQIAGEYFSVQKPQLDNVSSTGNGEGNSIIISGRVPWTITGMTDWCTVTQSSGSQDSPSAMTSIVKVSMNDKTDPRATTLVVTGEGYAPVEIPVFQHASKPLEVIAPSFGDMPRIASEYVFSIRSNTPWRIEGATDWCTLSQTTGDRDTNITVSLSNNGTYDIRRTRLEVIAEGYATYLIEVSQLGDNVLHYIPDPEFRQYLQNEVVKGEGMTLWTAAKWTGDMVIRFDNGQPAIKSLQGIQIFTSMKNLSIVETLPNPTAQRMTLSLPRLSSLVGLQSLYFENIITDEVYLAGLTSLESIRMNNSSLNSLITAGCTTLVDVDVTSNGQATRDNSFDFTDLPNLMSVRLAGNFMDITIKNCPQFHRLILRQAGIAGTVSIMNSQHDLFSMDFDNIVFAGSLILDNIKAIKNRFTLPELPLVQSVRVTNCTNLHHLSIPNAMRIKTLNISMNPYLREVEQLSNMSMTTLQTLYVNNSPLYDPILNLSKMQNLKTVDSRGSGVLSIHLPWKVEEVPEGTSIIADDEVRIEYL